MVYLAGIGAPAKSIDDVGATFDLCQDRGVPIVRGLSCHTNDHMVSFGYVPHNLRGFGL